MYFFKGTKGPWKVYQSGKINANYVEFEARFWVGFGETEWRGPSTLVDWVEPKYINNPVPSDTNKRIEHFKAIHSEAKANAALIAAAPEMFEALNQMLLVLEDHVKINIDTSNEIKRARANAIDALRKATGEV